MYGKKQAIRKKNAGFYYKILTALTLAIFLHSYKQSY